MRRTAVSQIFNDCNIQGTKNGARNFVLVLLENVEVKYVSCVIKARPVLQSLSTAFFIHLLACADGPNVMTFSSFFYELRTPHFFIKSKGLLQLKLKSLKAFAAAVVINMEPKTSPLGGRRLLLRIWPVYLQLDSFSPFKPSTNFIVQRSTKFAAQRMSSIKVVSDGSNFQTSTNTIIQYFLHEACIGFI